MILIFPCSPFVDLPYRFKKKRISALFLDALKQELNPAPIPLIAAIIPLKLPFKSHENAYVRSKNILTGINHNNEETEAFLNSIW